MKMILVAWAIGLVSWVVFELVPKIPVESHESVVRYAGEEAAARKACGGQKLMYWQVVDARASNATLRVRCTGQVTTEAEVRF